jgi:hypothetical protein
MTADGVSVGMYRSDACYQTRQRTIWGIRNVLETRAKEPFIAFGRSSASTIFLLDLLSDIILMICSSRAWWEETDHESTHDIIKLSFHLLDFDRIELARCNLWFECEITSDRP